MKPTVQFLGNATFHEASRLNDENNVEVWQYASVFAINHPKLGRTWVRTSKVLEIFDDGSFETMNTIYKRRVCPPCTDDCKQGRDCPA